MIWRIALAVSHVIGRNVPALRKAGGLHATPELGESLELHATLVLDEWRDGIEDKVHPQFHLRIDLPRRSQSGVNASWRGNLCRIRRRHRLSLDRRLGPLLCGLGPSFDRRLPLIDSLLFIGR